MVVLNEYIKCMAYHITYRIKEEFLLSVYISVAVEAIMNYIVEQDSSAS